jgi:SAD/SRA domain
MDGILFIMAWEVGYFSNFTIFLHLIFFYFFHLIEKARHRKQQIADQEFYKKRNNAMCMNCSVDFMAVRVFRGYNHSINPLANSYHYDGLFWVMAYWYQLCLKTGFKLCKFLLVDKKEPNVHQKLVSEGFFEQVKK